jgi:uncharacterized membrane protein YgcG
MWRTRRVSITTGAADKREISIRVRPTDGAIESMLVYVKYDGETYFARRNGDTYTVTLPLGTPWPEPILMEEDLNTPDSRLYIRAPNADIQIDIQMNKHPFKEVGEKTYLYVYTGIKHRVENNLWILENVGAAVKDLLVNVARPGQRGYLYIRYISIIVDNTKPYRETKPRNVYAELDGEIYGSGLHIDEERYLISLPDTAAERLSELQLSVDLPVGATIDPPVGPGPTDFSSEKLKKYEITAQDGETKTSISIEVEVLESNEEGSGGGGSGNGGSGGGGGCDAGLAGIAALALALALILLRPVPRRRSE